jgi:hypothetical protein
MKLKGHQIKTLGGFHPHTKLGMALKGVKHTHHHTGGKSCGEAVRHKKIKPLKFNF